MTSKNQVNVISLLLILNLYREIIVGLLFQKLYCLCEFVYFLPNRLYVYKKKPIMHSYRQINEIFGVKNPKSDAKLQKEFSENFFYPNVCQYCTKFDFKTTVKRCSSCHGMFYCSKEHHNLHWKDHKEFCRALKKMRITAGKEFLFQDCFMGDLGRRTHLISLAEIQLQRSLKPSERQVFLYPRVCLVCFESNPRVVKSCPNCPYGNFCTFHLDDQQHEKYCPLFVLSFFLDQYWLVFKDLPLELFVHRSPRNNKVVELPPDMEAFLTSLVAPCHKKLDFEIDEVRMLVSTVFTRALTLVYALEKLSLTHCSQLVVHVISKQKFQEENFIEWETVLHWFPKLKFLKICFIGCQMSPRIFNVDLCKVCKSRTLKIEISELLYKEYCEKNSRNPDIIVAYNVDINTYCTWIGASSLLANLNTPIVLTAMSEWNLNEAVRNCVANPQYFSRIAINPYESLKPERFSRYMGFPNHFISIYGNVFPKICGVDEPIDPCNDCLDCNLRNSKLEAWKEMLNEEEIMNKILKRKAERYTRIIKYMEECQKMFKIEFEAAKKATADCISDLEKKTLKWLQNLIIEEPEKDDELD